MTVNIMLMLVMLPEDYMDLNNWIELGLWISSIVGLLSNNKWGTALALFTLIYTLSTSVSIIIYYQVGRNVVRVIINTALTGYMFKHLLKSNTC
jgi:hypothetical protein